MSEILADSNAVSQLVQDNLHLAAAVSRSLLSRYTWVPSDEVYSYSLWGLVQAAQIYSPRKGLSFPAFAMRKAMFLAIDQMRRERVLRRKAADDETARQQSRQYALTFDLPDEHAADDQRAVDLKDTVIWVLRRLPDKDRKLLLMYYAEGMTLREIGRVLHLSEAALCLRRKALLAKLREAGTSDYRDRFGGWGLADVCYCGNRTDGRINHREDDRG